VKSAATVGLILPQPFGHLRPTMVQWIDLLREQLAERGARLHSHVDPACYGRNPARRLAQLCARQPADCWVSVQSSDAMQRWFAHGGRPVVIAGSTYADIDLPSVDLDYRAIGRHAAGMLLSRGHTRVGLIVRASPGAGDLATVAGFTEAVQESQRGAVAVIRRVEESRLGMARVLEALEEKSERPTGLVIANPHSYLAAATFLADRSTRERLALISRDDDPFLQFLTPSPARYSLDPETFARSLGTLVRLVLDGNTPVRRQVRLMSHFIEGDSLLDAMS